MTDELPPSPRPPTVLVVEDDARIAAILLKGLRASGFSVEWVETGALPPHDAAAAAQDYNWLVMGAPLNAAMLLGDEAIPAPAERRAHAASAVAALLRSIGAQR